MQDVAKNSSVANNGWVLCLSKRFPGKYYYFNVVSGEAVWGLNVNENNPLKKDTNNIQRINTNSHGYPEPSIPPAATRTWQNPSNPWHNTSARNTWPNTPIPSNTMTNTPNNWPNISNGFQNQSFPQTRPMFGQPPRFMTNLQPYIPNVVWPGITTPRSYMPTDFMPKLSKDQMTQTSEQDSEFIRNKNLNLSVSQNVVPDTEKINQKKVNTPLCQRCGNNQATNSVFSRKNKKENFVSSTPKKSDTVKFSNNFHSGLVFNLEDTSAVIEKSTITSTNKVDNPKSNLANNFENRSIRLRKRTRSESYIDSTSTVIEKSTLTSQQKAENTKSQPKRRIGCNQKYSLEEGDKVESSKSDEEDISNLGSCDLRFLLLAKRKKNEKPKIQDTPMPKKKVSFLLDNKDDISMSSSDEVDNQSPEPELIETSPSSEDTSQDMSTYNVTINNKTSPTQHNVTSTNSMPDNNSMPMYNISEDNTASSTNNMNQHKLLCKIPIKKVANSMPNFNVGNKTPTKTANSMLSSNKQFIISSKNIDNNVPMYNQQKNYFSNNTNTFYESSNILTPRTPTKRFPNIMPMHNISNEPLSMPSHYIQRNETFNSMPVHNMPRNKAVDSMPVHNMPRNEAVNSMPTHNASIEATNGMPTDNVPANQDIWYIVADMEVLLDEHTLIDQLLESDDKFRLLVPRSVRSCIESLCKGDCRGQQRVIVARQLSRRMSQHYKLYVAEPPSDDEDGPMGTTDGILNCCLKAVGDKQHVVLITNNKYLKFNAKSLKIPCFNIQEIKNGALKQLTGIKKIQITFNNKEIVQKYDFLTKNISNSTNIDKSSNTDGQTNKNCDILINITKSKTVNESDKSKEGEISNSLKKMKINDNKSSFSSQNTNSTTTKKADSLLTQKTNRYVENVQSVNTKSYNFGKINPLLNYDKNSTSNKPQNVKNIKKKSVINNQVISDMEINAIDKDEPKNMVIGTATTAAKQRIHKIMSAFNSKPSNDKNSNVIFKIPTKVPFKKGTKTTDNSNDIRTSTDNSIFKNKLSIYLKKFVVQNKIVYENVKTKMEEWICTYAQIMEEMFTDILLQQYADIIISTTNLHESLTCIKMLFDNNKLRNIIEILVDVLQKCSCKKGKLKADTKPEDFMTIIGCSALLIETLKTILPTAQIISDCELYLNSLINKIESAIEEIDPELFRSTVVCRSEVSDNCVRRIRNNFKKDPSYMLDYLKKHNKEWSTCNEAEIQDNNQQEVVNIVRVTGKNASMLKINNNKSISLTKDNKKFIDTKSNKSIEKTSNIEEKNEQTTTRITSKSQKSSVAEPKIVNFSENTDITMENPNPSSHEENAGPKIIRNIKLIDEYEKRIKEPLDLDVLDYSDFHEDNSSNNENYAVRKKKKLGRNKKQLLSLFEDINSESNYSDSVNINDVYGLQQINANDVSNLNNCGNTEETMNININNDNYARICKIACSETHEIQDNVTNNENYATNNDSNISPNMTEETLLVNNESYPKNNENYAANNESYVSNKSPNITEETLLMNNESYATNYENYASSNESCVNNYSLNLTEETLQINNEIYAANNGNYASKNDEKHQFTPKDDTTNDSGIENESTQALTLVHVFLNNLSSTFICLYEFINKVAKEISENALVEERKKTVYGQTCRCLEHIGAVIEDLNSIIERESEEDTELKRLLLQAGTEATTDKRVTRYWQIVRKCLEQAQILESALKTILCVTNGDLNSIEITEFISNIKYINIFE